MVHGRLRCAGGRERMRASIWSVSGMSHWMRLSTLWRGSEGRCAPSLMAFSSFL